jgi:hypothetical protein
MANADSIYTASLSAVLRKRDTAALRDFLKSEACARDLDRVDEIDEIAETDLEVRMYKMILTKPDLGDLHADARRWLKGHGFEYRAA